MKKVFELFATIGVDVDTYDRDLRSAEGKTERAGNKMSGSFGKVGQGLKVGVVGALTTVIALLGTVGAASGGAALALEADMQNVATLIDGNVERTAELTEELKQIAPKTGSSLSDLSDGLYQVVSAYGDSAEAAAQLELSAKAGKAGVATTTDAVNLLSAVTKGWGDTSLEAQTKVSDLAFQTVKLGQTTFPELAGSMGKVVTMSEQLGVSQEEMFAVFATATGVTGSAAEVATQYRGVLQALQAPTKDMTKLLGEYGYENGQALVESEGLAGAIELITKYAAENELPMQKLVSSIEGQTIAATLAGPQAESYADKLLEMANAAGATEEAFNTQQRSNQAFIDRIKASMQVMTVNLGQRFLPLLNEFLEWVVTKLPDIERFFDQAFDKIGTAVSTALEIVEQVKQTFEDNFGPVETIFAGVLATLQTFRNRFRDDLGDSETAVGKLGAKVKEWLPQVEELFRAAFELVTVLWQTQLKPTLEKVAPFFEATFNAALNLIGPTITAITSLLEAFTRFLSGDFKGAFESLETAVETIWQAIWDFSGTMWNGIKETILKVLEDMPGEMAEAGAEMINGLSRGITEKAEEVKEAIGGVATGVVNRFKSALDIFSPSRVFIELGKFITQGLAKGISDPKELRDLESKTTEVAGRVVSSVERGLTPVGEALDYLEPLAADLREGLLLAYAEGDFESYDLILGKLSTVESAIQSILATVDPLADARTWSDRLASEVERGFKAPVEALNLLEPRLEELKDQLAQEFEEGDLQGYNLVLEKIELIETAINRINGLELNVAGAPVPTLRVPGQDSADGPSGPSDTPDLIRTGVDPSAEQRRRENQELLANKRTAQALARVEVERQRAVVEGAREQMAINAELHAQALEIREGTEQAKADWRKNQDDAIFGALGSGTGQTSEGPSTGTRGGAPGASSLDKWREQMALNAAALKIQTDTIRAEKEAREAARREARSFGGVMKSVWNTVKQAGKEIGYSLLETAKQKVPAFGAAIEGFATGGPIGALTGMFTELLGSSEAFQRIMQTMGTALEPIAKALDELLTALEPLINVAITLFKTALSPLVWVLENVINPVFMFVAKAIATVWNAIATAINWALGWLGVNIPKIDLSEARDSGGETGTGQSDDRDASGTDFSDQGTDFSAPQAGAQIMYEGISENVMRALLAPLELLEPQLVSLQNIEAAFGDKIGKAADMQLTAAGMNLEAQGKLTNTLMDVMVEVKQLKSMVGRGPDFASLRAL